MSIAPSTVDAGNAAGTERARCRLCDADAWDTLVALSGYSVLRCQRCSFVFSDLPDSEIPGLYDEAYFQDEFGPYFSACFGSADAQLLESRFADYASCLEKYKQPGRVLEVGCAAGLFLDTLRRRGWTAEGAELSPHAAEAAREHTGLPIHVGDFSSLDLPAASYDSVCMLDMLEHLGDPAEGLRRARALLRAEGVLFLVLPDYRNLTTWLAMFAYRASGGRLDYPASRVHQIYHVSYFTAESISRLLSEQGFETVAILPDETIAGLLNEPLVVRIGVRIVFALSSALGLQNKMIVVAKLRDEPVADASRESS